MKDGLPAIIVQKPWLLPLALWIFIRLSNLRFHEM